MSLLGTREIRVKLQLVAAELQANEAAAKLRASYTELQKLDAGLAELKTKEESDG